MAQILSYKSMLFDVNISVNDAAIKLSKEHRVILNKNNFEISYAPSQNFVFTELKIKRNLKTKYFIEIEDSNLDSVLFYNKINNKLVCVGLFGDWVINKNKNLNSLLPVIGLDEIIDSTLFIKSVKKEGGIKIPIHLLKQDDLIKRKQSRDGFAFFYLGTIFIFFVVSVVFYSVLKEILYLQYSIFLFFWIFYYMSSYEYGNQYIWQNRPQLNDLFRALFASLVLFFYSNFTLNFLNVKQFSPNIYITIKILTGIGLSFFLFAGPFSVFSKETNNLYFHFFNGLTAIFILFILFISIYLLIRNDKNIKVYLVAVLPIFLSTALLISSETGVVIENFFLKNSLWISSIIESTSFLIIITYRHKETIQAKLNIQKDLILEKLNLSKIEKEVLTREKNRLAVNLHDGSIPILIAILRNLERNNSELDIKNALYINEVINDLRLLSHELSPNSRKSTDLESSIRQLLNIESEILKEVSYTWIDSRLEEGFKNDIYKVCSELYANALKHSKCKNMIVDFIWSEKLLKLYYQDDGIGFNLDDSKKVGIGIKNIKATIAKYGGILELSKNKNKGVLIKITFNNDN